MTHCLIAILLVIPTYLNLHGITLHNYTAHAEIPIRGKLHAGSRHENAKFMRVAHGSAKSIPQL